MAGPFDSLHIKGRNAGSPNELSFDVLDEKMRGADGQKKRSDKSPTGPKPSQGTYHGVAGSSTLSAAPEVAKRKRARRARAARTWVILGLVLFALVAAGAFMATRFYHDRQDFSGRFERLIEQFVEVDQTLAQVDTLMVSPFDAQGARDRAEVLSAIPALEQSLENIAHDARDLAGDALSDEDRAAVGEVENAVEARREMLDAADGVFTLSVVINKQISSANDAWNMVLSADEKAREASELANAAMTESATNQARDKTEEALDELAAARSSLAQLEKEATGLDLSAELAYIDKRTESLEAAVDTADALLANDRTAAVEANKAYNEADAGAAELASALSEPVGEKVRALHADDASRAQESYDAARARATAADSAIRSYR